MFSAHVEVAIREPSSVVVKRARSRLQPYHGVVGTSSRGWLDARITLPAEGIVQATHIAVAVVTAATGADLVGALVTSGNGPPAGPRDAERCPW